eukprot:735554-Alexandrium_andersonii.AAC.1
MLPATRTLAQGSAGHHVHIHAPIQRLGHRMPAHTLWPRDTVGLWPVLERRGAGKRARAVPSQSLWSASPPFMFQARSASLVRVAPE